MNTYDALQTFFGFTQFRPGQREAVEGLLQNRHSLVVMPTGAGKSLIFQLAALQLPGITLVISPLIALMKDQVDSLVRRNISATYISSSLSTLEQSNRLCNLAKGDYQIVYVAPERLRSVAFSQALRGQSIGLLAVDEAHCISVFVLEHEQMPEGNRLLLQKGGIAFPHPFSQSPLKMANWLKEKSAALLKPPTQAELF